MKVGTKSILFGVHQFILHPAMLVLGWWKCFGFPWDPRLWIAFFVHDLGYWGSPNLDGPEGERHPELGGRIMDRLFGKDWGDLCRYHSRSYARRMGKEPSRLCRADKMYLLLLPHWLFVVLANLSGELPEYLAQDNCTSAREWTTVATARVRVWMAEQEKK